MPLQYCDVTTQSLPHQCQEHKCLFDPKSASMSLASAGRIPPYPAYALSYSRWEGQCYILVPSISLPHFFFCLPIVAVFSLSSSLNWLVFACYCTKNVITLLLQASQIDCASITCAVKNLQGHCSVSGCTMWTCLVLYLLWLGTRYDIPLLFVIFLLVFTVGFLYI